MGRDNDLSDSQRRLIELFRKSPEPVLTATEVADAFDITQQAAHKRLSRLWDAGAVDRKEVGARAVVWWLNNDQAECSC